MRANEGEYRAVMARHTSGGPTDELLKCMRVDWSLTGCYWLFGVSCNVPDWRPNKHDRTKCRVAGCGSGDNGRGGWGGENGRGGWVGWMGTCAGAFTGKCVGQAVACTVAHTWVMCTEADAFYAREARTHVDGCPPCTCALSPAIGERGIASKNIRHAAMRSCYKTSS